MPRKYILALVALVAVAGAAALYFTLRNQIEIAQDNLTQSRGALQDKILEAMDLELQIVIAREESAQQQRLAEKEAADLKRRVESLSQEVAKAYAAQDARIEEIGKLETVNRELSQQVDTLKGAAAPVGWQDRLAYLQSRVLELEAELTSLRNSIPKAPLPGHSLVPANPSNPATVPQSPFTQPTGEIVRVGPGGSFVVLDYGRAKGAAQGQTLVLTRKQQSVGLIRLTHITEDFSIAQILNSTNTGDNLNVPDIHAGDKAHVY